MRFSLFQLLAVVTVSGLSLAALVQATPLAECLFLSATLAGLLAAAVCAAISTGESRAFWAGFAIAGGTYLVLAHVPDEDQLSPRHDGPEFTTQLLRLAYNTIHGGAFDNVLFSPRPEWTEIEGLALRIGTGQRIVADGTSPLFMRIGHCAWALLLAWLSGHFARAIWLRTRKC